MPKPTADRPIANRRAPSSDRRAFVREPLSRVATVVERNITALLDRRREEDERRGVQERMADLITRFTGSLVFVYLHLALFAAWILTNLGLVPGLGALRGFDDGFTVLAMTASVEAIFLSTFVLISQNRMQVQADKRADLDLQVSLLTEHEVTEILRMTREMARQMGIEQAHAPGLDELAQDIRPEVVLEHMEATAERVLGEDAPPADVRPPDPAREARR
jgi:uncharacterized membrane protein